MIKGSVNKLLYPNIERERKRKGLKRKELAACLDVDRDTYNAWIEGVYPIPANKVFALSGILRCSSDYLLAPDPAGERWKGYVIIKMYP